MNPAVLAMALMGEAIRLPRATIRRIKQNLLWAFIYNALGIPVAAFGFRNPMMAAIAIALSSLSVIIKSALLKGMELANKQEGIMERWLWICPWVGLVGAIVTFWYFGLSLLSALGVAFLLACPAVGVWTWRESGRAFGERDRLYERLGRGSDGSEKQLPKP